MSEFLLLFFSWRGKWGVGEYMLHAESLGLVWAKYDSYNLHTLTLIYTFQNLNTAVNDKV